MRVHVCVRPPNVGDVREWAMTGDIKQNRLIASEKEFAAEVANTKIVFVLDDNAPPESVYWFVTDPAKLSCPGKPAPKPYDKVAGSGMLPMLAAATSMMDAMTANPKKGDGQTSTTSSPEGKGPPLNFLEVLSRNLSIAGALATGDTSGSLKDPNGSRYGIPGGKNVGGPDLLILQAAAGTFALIGNPLTSGKQFIEKVTRALSEKKVVAILDAKVLSKEIAEKLAEEPKPETVKAALDALKRGEELSLESFGKAMAPSLREAAVILPYSRAQIFTKGWAGEFQAHHLLEVAMAEDILGMETKAIENTPAIILSEADHKAITKALDEARANFRSTFGKEVETPQELLAIYQKVYAGKPAWLEAIKSYFP